MYPNSWIDSLILLICSDVCIFALFVYARISLSCNFINFPNFSFISLSVVFLNQNPTIYLKKKFRKFISITLCRIEFKAGIRISLIKELMNMIFEGSWYVVYRAFIHIFEFLKTFKLTIKTRIKEEWSGVSGYVFMVTFRIDNTVRGRHQITIRENLHAIAYIYDNSFLFILSQ